MPFKRNPVRAEKINSLGRYLAELPRTAWDNAAHSLLERTLDDYANRRIILPEAFLAADEMLKTMHGILSGLRVDEAAMKRNLAAYGLFAATERVMMAAVKAGADRYAMHELIRGQSLRAWEVVRTGGVSPLAEDLAGDSELTRFLSAGEVHRLMDFTTYVGNAPAKARKMAARVRLELGD
jgi:adenylosuccinate lyase